MASNCPHCGSTLPDEARFCMACGGDRWPFPGQASGPGPGLVAGPGPARAARGRTGVWVATIAAACVVGAGITAGVLFLQNGDDGDADQARPAASGSRDPGGESPAGQDGRAQGGTDTDQDGRAQGGTDSDQDGRAQGGTDSDQDGRAQGGTDSDQDGQAQGGTDGSAPAGYHQVTDIQGFSFAVPAEWTRQGVKNGSQITYSRHRDIDSFLVGVIPHAGYASYDNFTNMERIARKKKAGYERIKLEQNTFQGRTGAIWEYLYMDADGNLIHCKDQGYVAENGTEFSILLSGADARWESELASTYRTALDSWRLT